MNIQAKPSPALFEKRGGLAITALLTESGQPLLTESGQPLII